MLPFILLLAMGAFVFARASKERNAGVILLQGMIPGTARMFVFRSDGSVTRLGVDMPIANTNLRALAETTQRVQPVIPGQKAPTVIIVDDRGRLLASSGPPTILPAGWSTLSIRPTRLR